MKVNVRDANKTKGTKILQNKPTGIPRVPFKEMTTKNVVRLLVTKYFALVINWKIFAPLPFALALFPSPFPPLPQPLGRLLASCQRRLHFLLLSTLSVPSLHCFLLSPLPLLHSHAPTNSTTLLLESS